MVNVGIIAVSLWTADACCGNQSEPLAVHAQFILAKVTAITRYPKYLTERIAAGNIVTTDVDLINAQMGQCLIIEISWRINEHALWALASVLCPVYELE